MPINTISFENWEAKWHTSNVADIIATEMTRNRTLDDISKTLPCLKIFLEWLRKHPETVIDLWMGDGYLLDDIKREFWIKWLWIDGQWFKRTPWIKSKSHYKMNIKNTSALPTWIWYLYSIYTLQYLDNAPTIIDEIYKKLKPGGNAYIQFPVWLRSTSFLDKISTENDEKNLIIIGERCDKSIDEREKMHSIAFILHKDEDPIHIPNDYITQKWYHLINSETKKIMKNSELFHHYFLPNDPELAQS